MVFLRIYRGAAPRLKLSNLKWKIDFFPSCLSRCTAMYKQLKEWKRGNACCRLWWEILLSLFTKIFTHSLLIKLNVSHERNWLYWMLNGVWFSEFVWWKYSLYCLIPSIIRHDSTVIEFTKMPLVTLISARSPLLLFSPSARPLKKLSR